MLFSKKNASALAVACLLAQLGEARHIPVRRQYPTIAPPFVNSTSTLVAGSASSSTISIPGESCK